jgi:hypothetical protein
MQLPLAAQIMADISGSGDTIKSRHKYWRIYWYHMI